MKVIDWERKGQCVRFYFGLDDLENWWGDDWNDAPYEHNAGTVYYEFIQDAMDVHYPFDCAVIEPRDGELNSYYCKDDMIARRVPCILTLVDTEPYYNDVYSYSQVAGDDNAQRIYMGDSFEDWREKVIAAGGKFDSVPESKRWWKNVQEA